VLETDRIGIESAFKRNRNFVVHVHVVTIMLWIRKTRRNWRVMGYLLRKISPAIPYKLICLAKNGI